MKLGQKFNRVKQSATALSWLPNKIWQSHLFTLFSYSVHEQILVSVFHRLARKKSYGFSLLFSVKVECTPVYAYTKLQLVRIDIES